DDADSDSQSSSGAFLDVLRRDRWNGHGGDARWRGPGNSDRWDLEPPSCAGGSIAQRLFAARLFFRYSWTNSRAALCESAPGLPDFALSKRNDTMGCAADRLFCLRLRRNDAGDAEQPRRILTYHSLCPFRPRNDPT